MNHKLSLKKKKNRWLARSIFRLGAMEVREFTSDDLHKWLTPPHHRNWWGVITATLAARGLIEEIDRVVSERPSRNGAKVSLWHVK